MISRFCLISIYQIDRNGEYSPRMQLAWLSWQDVFICPILIFHNRNAEYTEYGCTTNFVSKGKVEVGLYYVPTPTP